MTTPTTPPSAPAHSPPHRPDHTDTTLRVRRLDERAALPKAHSRHAAGLDLAACLPRVQHTGPITLEPGAIAKVPTGIAIAIEPGFEGQIRPRSGLATTHAITLPNAPGTIDADYRGELFVALINLGRDPFTIEHAMRIAQLVIAPVARADILETDELDPTDRADAGFGSTGL